MPFSIADTKINVFIGLEKLFSFFIVKLMLGSIEKHAIFHLLLCLLLQATR